MIWQQLFQLTLTILFVAALILLFTALILFHLRLFIEGRRKRKESRKDNH